MQAQGLATGRGLRPINAARVRSSQLAETFSGLPAGVSKYEIKAWLQVATSRAMGIGRAAKKLLQNLVDTAAPDAYASRGASDSGYNAHMGLVVFKSNRRLAEELEVGEEAIRKSLKQLADAGWIAFRDSTTRKRFAQRDERTGEILVAFGIDLRVLCARADELRELANVSDAEISLLRDIQRNISSLFNQLRVFAAHPCFGPYFTDQEEVLRLADKMRKSRNIVLAQEAFIRLVDRRSELETLFCDLAERGLLEADYRGARQKSSHHRTSNPQPKNQERSGISFGEEEASIDGFVAEFAAAVEAAEACAAELSRDGVPDLSVSDEHPTPVSVRVPGVNQMLKTLPDIMLRAGVEFHASSLFSDPKRLIDGYANNSATICGLSRAEIQNCRETMGDQAFRTVAFLARFKAGVSSPRAYLLGLRNKISLARLSDAADTIALDLNRSWFGLYRGSKSEVVH
ncbi:helix-turn-helix domain-containing protein [Caulobacter sp. CCH5-E12]|uniref:helix-turn-helix domain-containing protein n=1 Tax=Caulobacter sp. CCH5-E12 TaxID=1768770 RepID=UPI000780E832|nr:helix-turn-helix domain-containing protein [Caulobacter sp. CCH5-E12]